MRHHLPLLWRFILFHILLLLAISVFSRLFIEVMAIIDGWPIPLLIVSVLAGIETTLDFGAVLLVPSLLVWWLAGAALGRLGISGHDLPPTQGAITGLFTSLCLKQEMGWMPQILLGIPFGIVLASSIFLNWFPMRKST